MNQTEVAHALGAPTKRIKASWLASLNYVRNVAAHHARLFHRKLQNALSRPKVGQIPVVNHLRDSEDAKRVYGIYNTLAVVAYVLRSVETETDWTTRLTKLLHGFPTSATLTIESPGASRDRDTLKLWRA